MRLGVVAYEATGWTFRTPDGGRAYWVLLDPETDELKRGFRTLDELSAWLQERR